MAAKRSKKVSRRAKRRASQSTRMQNALGRVGLHAFLSPSAASASLLRKFAREEFAQIGLRSFGGASVIFQAHAEKALGLGETRIVEEMRGAGIDDQLQIGTAARLRLGQLLAIGR